MSVEPTLEELRLKAEKLDHISKMLRAVRSVNQLITRETDQDRLLKRACELLVETHGWLLMIRPIVAMVALYCQLMMIGLE